MKRRFVFAAVAALAIPSAIACSSPNEYPGGGRRLSPPGGDAGYSIEPADAGAPPPDAAFIDRNPPAEASLFDVFGSGGG